MKITIISDTHRKHNQLNGDLIGGDLLLHAGDISSQGFNTEIEDFVHWYDRITVYKNKLFIAGNHDWGFETKPSIQSKMLESYTSINYLQDSSQIIDGIKIYGSPWQPEFCNWAFNLPKNGEQLKKLWADIPNDTTILITHCPAYGFLDDVEGKRGIHLGCELLAERIKEIKPKIHICGHIHTGHGYMFDGHTHYFNASVLDERYNYAYLPFNIDWDPITNEIIFL